MIKQIAWNTFKNTGNISTMLELIEMDKALKENEKERSVESETEFLIDKSK